MWLLKYTLLHSIMHIIRQFCFGSDSGVDSLDVFFQGYVIDINHGVCVHVCTSVCGGGVCVRACTRQIPSDCLLH